MKRLALWSAFVKSQASDLRQFSFKDEKEVWEFTSTKTNQVYWASAFPKFRGQGLSLDSAQLSKEEGISRTASGHWPKGSVYVCVLPTKLKTALRFLAQECLSAGPRSRSYQKRVLLRNRLEAGMLLRQTQTLSHKLYSEIALSCFSWGLLIPVQRNMFWITCTVLNLAPVAVELLLFLTVSSVLLKENF